VSAVGCESRHLALFVTATAAIGHFGWRKLRRGAGGAQKRDFICKTEVALKEARETKYWLRLLLASELISATRVSDLQTEADEIARILGAIVVSAK
jgi:four helix bundle protein